MIRNYTNKFHHIGNHLQVFRGGRGIWPFAPLPGVVPHSPGASCCFADLEGCDRRGSRRGIQASRLSRRGF